MKPAATFASALSLVLAASSAYADAWDDSIKKAKNEERQNETPEERERREEREERTRLSQQETKNQVFVAGGLGIIHHKRQTDVPDNVRLGFDLGASLVVPLGWMWAVQGRASLFITPPVEHQGYGNNGPETNTGPIVAGLVDATFRYTSAGRSVGLIGGVGPIAGITSTPGNPDAGPFVGAVFDLGLRFGPSKEFEALLRPTVGTWDKKLSGIHVFAFGWSPVGF